MSFQRKLGKQLRAEGFHVGFDPETNEPMPSGMSNPQGVKVATHRDPGDSRVGIVKVGSDPTPALQFLRSLGCEVEEQPDGFVVVSPPTDANGGGATAFDGGNGSAPAVSREISQREFRNDSGKIMRELDRGQMFLVTRNGVPVGELTPLRRGRFVAAEEVVERFQAAPSVDYRTLRADLDAAADQDPMPRG